MALALPAAQDICLCPLHAPLFDYIDVRWFTHEYETETPTRRRVCCRRRPAAPPSINGVCAPRVLQLIIFELISQIAGGDCHLTAKGYGSRTEGPLASCWVEPRADCVSYREWAQSVNTIHHILDSIRDPYSTDELIVQGNPLRYQLFYEPPEGRSLQQSLPLYETDGRCYIPMSLSQVPFGRVMHFLFTIHYSRNLNTTDGPTITNAPRPCVVYAEIYAIMSLD